MTVDWRPKGKALKVSAALLSMGITILEFCFYVLLKTYIWPLRMSKNRENNQTLFVDVRLVLAKTIILLFSVWLPKIPVVCFVCEKPKFRRSILSKNSQRVGGGKGPPHFFNNWRIINHAGYEPPTSSNHGEGQGQRLAREWRPAQVGQLCWT